MQKAIKLLFVFVLAGVLIAGSGGNKNLSDLTVVQGLAVDMTEKNVSVTLQYLNLAKSTGGTDTLAKNITATATGESVNISEAISSVSKNLSRAVFFGQNKVIVIGMDYAKSGVSKGMDYMLRSVDSRPDVYLALASNSGASIIKNSERNARVPAKNIYDLIDVSAENGNGVFVTVNDVLDLYSDETSDFFLPVLNEKGDSVYCCGVAVFSDEKYALTLTPYQTFGFNLLNGEIKSGTMTVKNNSLGIVGVQITKDNVKKSVTVDGNKIYFNCDITLNVVLNDVEKGITVRVNDKSIAEIEKSVGSKAKEQCLSAFETCSQAGTDPFVVGKYLAKSNSAVYEYYKKSPSDNIKKVIPNFNVRARLTKINDNSLRS